MRLVSVPHVRTLLTLTLLLLLGCGRTSPDRGSQTPPPSSNFSVAPAPAARVAAGPESPQVAARKPVAETADPALLARLHAARGPALCALAKTVDPKKDAALLEPALEHVHRIRRDVDSRDCGFELLTALGANAALPGLAAQPNTPRRWMALIAWANRNLRAKLWPVYGLALQKGDPFVRSVAVTGLGNYDPEPKVIGLLTGALADNNPAVRKRSAQILGQLGGDAARAALVARLTAEKDPSITVALEAAVKAATPR